MMAVNRVSSMTMQRTIIEAFVKMVVCHKVTVQQVAFSDGHILESHTTQEEGTPVILNVTRHETSDMTPRSAPAAHGGTLEHQEKTPCDAMLKHGMTKTEISPISDSAGRSDTSNTAVLDPLVHAGASTVYGTGACMHKRLTAEVVQGSSTNSADVFNPIVHATTDTISSNSGCMHKGIEMDQHGVTNNLSKCRNVSEASQNNTGSDNLSLMDLDISKADKTESMHIEMERKHIESRLDPSVHASSGTVNGASGCKHKEVNSNLSSENEKAILRRGILSSENEKASLIRGILSSENEKSSLVRGMAAEIKGSEGASQKRTESLSGRSSSSAADTDVEMALDDQADVTDSTSSAANSGGHRSTCSKSSPVTNETWSPSPCSRSHHSVAHCLLQEQETFSASHSGEPLLSSPSEKVNPRALAATGTVNSTDDSMNKGVKRKSLQHQDVDMDPFAHLFESSFPPLDQIHGNIRAGAPSSVKDVHTGSISADALKEKTVRSCRNITVSSSTFNQETFCKQEQDDDCMITAAYISPAKRKQSSSRPLDPAQGPGNNERTRCGEVTAHGRHLSHDRSLPNFLDANSASEQELANDTSDCFTDTLGGVFLAGKFGGNTSEPTETVVCGACKGHFHSSDELFSHVCSSSGHANMTAPIMRGVESSTRHANMTEQIIKSSQSAGQDFRSAALRQGRLEKSSQWWTQHNRKHSSLVCPVCSKSFIDNSGLRQHLLIHSDHRQFGCHICSKRFKQRAHLTTHLKFHMGVKRYRCDQCGQAYVQRGDLLRHLRSLSHTTNSNRDNTESPPPASTAASTNDQ